MAPPSAATSSASVADMPRRTRASAGRLTRTAKVREAGSALPETSRTRTVTVRGYDTTYSTDPDDRRLIRRTLIDEFPAEQLASDASHAKSSWKDENPVRLIEINP